MARWKNKDVELLKKYYPRSSWAKIHKLFPFRSRESIKKKAVALGLSRYWSHEWTLEEEQILKKHYPLGNWTTLLKKLPSKTKNAIIRKASGMDIKRKHRSLTVWTKEQEDILTECYNVDNWNTLLNKFPGKTRKAIYCKARLLGLTRGNQHISVKTGEPLQWPGMPGGPEAYGMTEEEWTMTPTAWHKKITSRGYQFTLILLICILLQGCCTIHVHVPPEIYQHSVEPDFEDILTVC